MNKQKIQRSILHAVGLLALWCPDGWAVDRQPPRAAAQIEVAFVLDTTGSMSGLIEGAKQKIWSIANQMISAKPTPKIKIGLLGYRDRGDEYITKSFDLTADIDQVYANLQKFQAGGGGDGPESVNQALQETVAKMSWSASPDVLKIIFLVGDFPPHMDYGDDIKYPEVLQTAVKKDLIVNTVQCGQNSETATIWQDIARRGEGRYVAIGQSGDMQIVSTPMDAELAELNVALGRTMVAYGSTAERGEVKAKQHLAEAAAAPVAAERMMFNARTGKVVQGKGDLLDDMASGSIALDGLSKEELPDELADKSPAEQKKYLDEKSQERKRLQSRQDELLAKRQSYLEAENRKLVESGKGGGFDTEVFSAIQEQAKRKGISYER